MHTLDAAVLQQFVGDLGNGILGGIQHIDFRLSPQPLHQGLIVLHPPIDKHQGSRSGNPGGHPRSGLERSQ